MKTVDSAHERVKHGTVSTMGLLSTKRLIRFREALCSFMPVACRAAHGVVLALLVLCALAPQAFAASTTLQWDPNSEPDLSGYTIHYGSTVSRAYATHLDVGKTVVSQSITGLADGTTYYFAVTARDTFGNESGYSNEVVLTPGTETISTPLAPSGPATGTAGVSYTYTASGAVSTGGDTVQYRFSWSDGSDSGWLPAGVTSASKAWSSAGTYTPVRVEARCSLHTSIVSSPSPALTVSIGTAPQETVSVPSAPSGPTNGAVGTAYSYSTGGAVSSSGHSVEYQFSWADGSVSQWLPAGTTSASKTWNASGTYTLVAVQARCALHPSILSAKSPSITVTISSGVVETVSTPTAPAGPAGGYANDLHLFSTGGSVSSAGDPVVYRFHWGDGTTSEWVGPGQPVTAGKSWSVPGTYFVQAEASCSTHPTVGSFSPAVEVSIAESNAPTLLAASFVGAGLWVYSSDSAAWARVGTKDPKSMVYSGSTIYGDYEENGIWAWNGASWSQLTGSNPENMAVNGSTLYGDFGAGGLWMWNGTAWSQLTGSNPENMAVNGSTLYGDFGAGGLWMWNGAAWSQFSASNPENMAVNGSTLYGDFGAGGLWMWNGAAWSQFSVSNPENMAINGSTLYGDFGAAGIWTWNGSSWSKISGSNLENMAISGSTLYGDFGASGIWTWNGSSWSKINGTNPDSMLVSGSKLYADLGASGIWVWDGVAWSQLTGSNPIKLTLSK